MATSTVPGSSTSSTQEYTVRIPKDKLKSFNMMKFGSGVDLDFAKLGNTSVTIARENNLKEFKTANDIDLMPKFGAGSEFGREQKEEARRKKYGRMSRKYNPEDQPWSLKLGTDKKCKKYKGVREGTITDNTSYYIFTQCADGAFEAYPVDEWYNFTPVVRYKYLNSDEAEEHFSRRDKTLNYFNIMVKKRMKIDDGTEEHEEEKKDIKNKKKSKKDFLLTDQDDWRDISEDEENDEDEGEENDEDKKDKTKKGKKKKGPVKKRKNAKINSDDEAVEESDEGDYDDREVDYMSDSSSNPSDKEEVEDKEKDNKDEEKGVAEEDGLRVLIDSEAEDEEENEEKDENVDVENDQKAKKEDESESSSSSSGSDSDIEKDESISSALFMAKGSEKKKSDTRPAIPNEDRGIKRKLDVDGVGGKKARTNSPVPTSSSSTTSTSSNTGSSSEGITEEAIRRYLMRKPMTTKDLLTKFRSKKLNMTSEQMTHTVAQLLKKINPDKKFINKVLYLSLKKTD